MSEELPKLLLGIIEIQTATIESMTEIAAEVNALRLTLSSIHPSAEAIHATLLPKVREKLVGEMNRQQASLELIKAALSTIQ
jgi:hypothetical protein